MKKKNLLILGFVGLMSLAACTSSSTNVDQYLPTDDPESEVTIRFWHCFGHNKGSNVFKTIDAFNDMYAGKYKIEEEKLEGEYNALQSTIMIKLANHESAGLAIGYPDAFSEYMTEDIEESFILRIDNFLKDSNYGFEMETINYNDRTFDCPKDFIPGYFEEGNQYQFSGTWSMPLYKSTEVVFFNASNFAGANDENVAYFAKQSEQIKNGFTTLYDAVDKAAAAATDVQLNALRTYCENNGGYTYEIPSKPKTVERDGVQVTLTPWQQFLELGQEILDNRTAEGLSNKGIVPLGYDSDSNLMITQMAQRDIPYTKIAEYNDDRYLFNNNEAKALLTEITDAIADGVLTTKGVSGNNTSKPFGDRTLFASVGSTGGTSYNISANFRVGIAPVPYSNKPLYIQQGPSICFFDNGNEYIHKGAWLFYKMLVATAEETIPGAISHAELACLNNYDPIRYSTYGEPYYTNWITTDQDQLTHYVPNVTKTLVDYYMTSPVFPGSSQARTSIGDTIKNVSVTGDTPEEALVRAYGECTA